VDESRTFDLYEAAGFGKIGDVANPSQMPAPPGFDLGQWFKYLANVIALAPIRKDEKLTGPPEGVLRLGGTFAVDGENITYAHAEELPGTSPEVRDVMRASGFF
jgi:hypothetical protein